MVVDGSATAVFGGVREGEGGGDRTVVDLIDDESPFIRHRSSPVDLIEPTRIELGIPLCSAAEP